MLFSVVTTIQPEIGILQFLDYRQVQRQIDLAQVH